MRASAHCSNVAGNLSERDISILRAYTFKVDQHLMDEAFAKILYAFPKEAVPTVKVCRSQLQALSGFKPVRYDCCINSCCCFAGDHKDRINCLYCGQDQWIIDCKGRKKHGKCSTTCHLFLVLLPCRPTPPRQTKCDIELFNTHTPLVQSRTSSTRTSIAAYWGRKLSSTGTLLRTNTSLTPVTLHLAFPQMGFVLFGSSRLLPGLFSSSITTSHLKHGSTRTIN